MSTCRAKFQRPIQLGTPRRFRRAREPPRTREPSSRTFLDHSRFFKSPTHASTQPKHTISRNPQLTNKHLHSTRFRPRVIAPGRDQPPPSTMQFPDTAQIFSLHPTIAQFSHRSCCCDTSNQAYCAWRISMAERIPGVHSAVVWRRCKLAITTACATISVFVSPSCHGF